MSAQYTNQIRYNFNQHEVRLNFFDRAQVYAGPVATPIHEADEPVAEVIMTRQAFRSFLAILNEMATRMPPIGIPDPADREPPAAHDEER